MEQLSTAAGPVCEGWKWPSVTFRLLTVLLSFSVISDRGRASEATPTHQSAQCRDWETSGEGVVRVYQGEVGRLSCPIFHLPSASNHSLRWYRIPAGHAPLQPIDLSVPGHRVSRERERLWFQPAVPEDAGRYVCMLRNGTRCWQMAVQLEVYPRAEEKCVSGAVMEPHRETIALEEGKTLQCPDLQEFQLSYKVLSVAWFHKYSTRCIALPVPNRSDREVKDNSLLIYTMQMIYTGNYTCVVTYHSAGRTLNFTRAIIVKPKLTDRLKKTPIIHNPDQNQVFTVKLGSEARLDCRALMFDVELEPRLWWEIDGRTLEQLSDDRITYASSYEETILGERTMKNVLIIQDFSSKDLEREYACHARNHRGNATTNAVLRAEDYIPSVELGCGLGAALLFVLLLFVVYHVYRLELLLLYRAYCGPDESATDGKEYDVYISYARNSEEEKFVLLTLRKVLENELGYKVFIFDRDSLPGGTITDETLSCVGRSRRLMVVLSPRYVVQGTQALLELKAGLDTMAQAGNLRVILVQYQPLSRDSWVRELRRARVALTLVQWKGDKSSDLSSRFWKRLQVELPVRRANALGADELTALPLTTYTHAESAS
ncbi:hypothetical protein AAFF_G00440840 [Aldrovandia affinis]|uniref:Interleukin-1 receptor accessory protein n=1 Tax=Aldrovandia affinis TaxID=143900 RepID=A0AAD7S780_9TELE|nr:hypothetical protein AAFF_G00440840 [Aldrovandia affinis]